ncbi:MAG: hypothetical protein U1F54_13570 [Burkholderiales bacterium]
MADGKHFMEKVKEEFVKVIPPTVFFFIALNIIAIVRRLLTSGTGLPTSSLLQIALAALIIGKAVLIADIMPMINRFPEKPLAYNIAWKTMIYYAMATLIHYLERVYDASKEAGGGFEAGNALLLEKIVWPHFWGMQIVIFVVILNYCVIRELGRALGEERVFRLFFRHDLPKLQR